MMTDLSHQKKLLSTDEVEAVKTVLALADKYGFGNMIGHLKRRWMEKLIEQGFDKETAKRGADTSAYPLDWTIEALEKAIT